MLTKVAQKSDTLSESAAHLSIHSLSLSHEHEAEGLNPHE